MYEENVAAAIADLPDRDAAARRAAYGKLRADLAAELRAEEPPLPVREITTRRLALEDAIRSSERARLVALGYATSNDE